MQSDYVKTTKPSLSFITFFIIIYTIEIVIHNLLEVGFIAIWQLVFSDGCEVKVQIAERSTLIVRGIVFKDILLKDGLTPILFSKRLIMTLKDDSASITQLPHVTSLKELLRYSIV